MLLTSTCMYLNFKLHFARNLYIKALYFMPDLSISQLGMPKERKIAPPGDAADPNKLPQNFRLTKETIRKLEKAALEYGMSKTVYVELALKDRFRKDAIA